MMGTIGPSLDSNDGLKLKSVVYATDFSVWSQNAGFYAALFAKFFKATLLVSHAFTLSQAAMEVEIENLSISQQRKDLKVFLATNAATLTSDSVEVFPELLEGRPEIVVPDLAAKHAPSLIVLGTHGGNWMERGLIGSVAEAILRSARSPCVTVGPKVQSAASATSLAFNRILYATDLTPAAADAAVYAVSFARAFGAEIDVLNVIHSDDVEHPDRLSKIEEHFYGALNRLVPERANEFSDSRTFVKVGQAHERILDHIKDRAIDLLVLGIRRDSHLGLLARRSGAYRLIVHAYCPVLTLTR